MTGRMLRLSPMLLLAVTLAACGGTKTVTVTVTTTVTTIPTATTTPTLPGTPLHLRVYFLQKGLLAAAGRDVQRTPQVATAALEALLAGTSKDEESFGYTTEIPVDAKLKTLTIAGGVASVEITPALSHQGRAQVVATLTQFPTVKKVETGGKSYTRKDFEDVSPAILVEAPLPGEVVASPLHVTGTANTFEATFEYDLTDPDGLILKHGFTTATSGSGTRGTFDFTIPFETTRSGLGELIVYERSAANGKRVHIVEIPIRF